MKRALSLACGVFLLCCRRSPSPAPAAAPPSDPQVVADWNGGRATLTEVEGALLALSPTERLSREADIVKTYKDVAREKALAQVLLPKGPGGGQVALEASAPEAYRPALVQLYTRDVALQGRDVAVGEDEVKAYYEGHRKQFHRERQVFLYNIYKRRQGAAEDPVAFLAGLKKRVQGGEPFTTLARAHSDSETRANDGMVGWVERGAMAPQLERVALSLKEGQVSDPVAVPSGAVLLYAQKVVPEKSFAYPDARTEIQRVLERKKLRDALEAWVKEVALPSGSVVLSQPELAKALASGADDQPVLRIGETTLTRGEFKKALPAPAAGADQAQVFELYRQRVRNELLLSEARRSGYAGKPETAAELDRLLRRSLERKAVEDRLEARLKGDLAPQDADLRKYYDEHPQRFTSPLKLRLRLLVVDITTGFGRQMRELEAVRADLAAGKLTLDDAARKLGGRVEEIGWREVARLGPELQEKERRYILDLDKPGFTVPYQRGGSLRLFQVAERQEPARRPYEQARADILEAYLKDKRKDLMDAAAERVLADAHFRFFEDRVRAALAVTAPKAAAPPAK
jgi:PPIC-type peptidyl-prolyl cis-trans isomerase-like protein/parvulin-like peptidyl-prolyl cis-trans isomerase-like protein